MKIIEKLCRKQGPKPKAHLTLERFDSLFPTLSDTKILTKDQLQLRDDLINLQMDTYSQVPPFNNLEYPPEEIRKRIEEGINTCLTSGATPDMIIRLIDPEHTLYPNRWDLTIIKEVIGYLQSSTTKNR